MIHEGNPRWALALADSVAANHGPSRERLARHTNRQTDRQTETDRQPTSRDTDRQTETQAHRLVAVAGLRRRANNCSASAVALERSVECAGNLHAPWTMWMTLPHQSGRRQGVCSASCNLLAIEDLGIGSGWQQSKQHWALPAVIGHSVRMGHGRLYSVKAHNSKHISKLLDSDFWSGSKRCTFKNIRICLFCARMLPINLPG